MPSFNLLRYLHARASGQSVEAACAVSGIGMGEAALHETDIASGELELPHVHVHARGEANSPPKNITQNISDEGETSMANGTVAADELRLLIERIERLEEERKALADDKSDVFQEAKSRGFDTAAMKRVIKLRKMEPQTRQEAEAILALYLSAVGLSDAEETIALAVAA
jgi:uncharacterized protein (UPF0335 family)